MDISNLNSRSVNLSKKLTNSLSPSAVRTFTFVFLESIVAVTVSLGWRGFFLLIYYSQFYLVLHLKFPYSYSLIYLYFFNILFNSLEGVKCFVNTSRKSLTDLFLLLCWSVCPCAVMVKALDCGIVISEFELQSYYNIHFRTNTLKKGMNPLYPPRYGLNTITTVLVEGWLWH